MQTIVRFKKGEVANKVACILDAAEKTVEVSLKGHKLKVKLNDDGSYDVIEN